MTLPPRRDIARPPPVLTRNAQHGPGQTAYQATLDEMSPPTPGVDDMQFIRFALDQLTRDEDVLGGRESALGNRNFPGARNIPSPPPRAPDSVIPGPTRPPPRKRTSSPPPLSQPRRPVPDETMRSVHPPHGQAWADLGYKPLPLRPWYLAIYLFFCLLALAGVLFSNLYASRNHGLYDYNGYTTAIYFVFQYLPQLLGMVLILWLLYIQAAVYRSAPFFSMSNARSQDHILQGFRILPANYLLPDLNWFRLREPLLGVAFLIFWSFNITIPLLSCLYQTQWVTNAGTARWRWTTAQDIGWALVAMFGLLILAITYLLIRFARADSALMWDPTSLADLIVLFSRSNVAQYFERTEVEDRVGPHIPPMSLMLGYWTTSQRPDIFYGVGGDNALVKRISIEPSAPMQEKEAHSQDSSFDVERQRYSHDSSFTRNIHSPFVRYRWAPWFLRDISIIVWIVLAMLLIIAFLVVSFVNRAVQDGFDPLLPSITGRFGFSSSNFLYSFLPSLLGMIMFLLWQPIDVYFRAAQPFANMAKPSGSSAERSLLLAYPSSPPLWVSVEAALNRDFKVAYISFISVLAALIPALAGGVFTAQLFRDAQSVRMVASMPGYIALCVFVAIYALSYAVIWPTRKRYLPHSIYTLADQLSFLYASGLMSELWNIRTKANLVARLVGTPAGLTGDWREKRPRAKYAFGVYIGRDGKEHLGIDRLSRPGSGEMLVVTTGMQR
jgi:hypothetical protein